MSIRILNGDCRSVLASLPAESVNCCVTSPPYFGLRDYGVAGQIGLEGTPDAFVTELVDVFREVRRVLKNDGTLWLNLGDSYTTGASTAPRKSDPKAVADVSGGVRRIGTPQGLKAKDLIGVPWRVAFALQADGWYLRQDIIWSKPNPMPESVTDRCTKAHEYLFLLSKGPRYFFDQGAILEPHATPEESRNNKHGTATMRGQEAIRPRGNLERVDDAAARYYREGGRNKRSVWEVATAPFAQAHFATFPPALIEPCILAGCPKGGTVLDPFGGAGTTGLVADRLGRNAVLIELNPDYAAMAERRIRSEQPMFADVTLESAA